MNRDRNLENYVQLSARAGDQIEVKKSMEKQIAAEFNRDKDRYGWRQPAHAGIDRFDALDAEAEHYRKLGDKGLIDLAATRRKQRALLDIYGSIDTPGSGRAKRVDADLARLTDK